MFDINPLGSVVPPQPEAPKIYSEQYQHSIVQGTYQPETSLITLVQGIPVVVEYYRQRLRGSEEPAPFDPSNAATYQSYTRIRHLIIKLEGNDAFNFNPEKGESSSMYSGWVTCDVAPIRGDVFIAEIKDGRAGLFQITEQPEIVEFTANKVYRITILMVGILQKDWADELERRVQQELVYSIDSALSGGVGLVNPDDFNTMGELFSWTQTISSWIMRNWWWRPEETIAYPVAVDKTGTRGTYCYDQYLIDFLSAIITPDMRAGYPVIGRLSTQYGGRAIGTYGTVNIWDVILRGDINLLPMCKNSEAAMIGVDRITGTRLYGNLRSSKFGYFITTDPEEYKVYKTFFNMDGYPILRATPEKKVTYMFSEEFYNGVPTETFEKILYQSLKDKVIDRKTLLKYCKDEYFALPELKQLYYGGIIIFLINISRKIGVPS